MKLPKWTLLKRPAVRLSLVIGVLLAVILATGLVTTRGFGLAGSSFDLSWNNLANGGTMGNTGGSYSLSGTIGQPAVEDPLPGGSYTLNGGFWNDSLISRPVYLPIVRK